MSVPVRKGGFMLIYFCVIFLVPMIVILHSILRLSRSKKHILADLVSRNGISQTNSENVILCFIDMSEINLNILLLNSVLFVFARHVRARGIPATAGPKVFRGRGEITTRIKNTNK